MTGQPPQRALAEGGVRLLAGLAAVTVLSLLVGELSHEKQQLLAPQVLSRPPAATGPARQLPAPVASPPAQAGLQPSAPAPMRPPAAAPARAGSPARSFAVAAAEQPPATVPARAGTWAYAFSVNGSTQQATLQVRRYDTASLAHDEQTWTSGGDVRTEGHDWTAHRMTTTTSNSCRWSPADTSLVLPLRKGATWSSRTSCRNSDGSTTSASTTSTVKGWTKVTIGGQQVATWVIDRTVRTVVSSAKVTASGSSAVTDFFAPAYGLTVVESVRTSYPGPDGAPQVVDAVRRLQSTRPT